MSALVTALLRDATDEDLAAFARALAPYLPNPSPDGLLTPAQAAEVLGVHPKTVSRWARTGRIHAVKLGSSWRFDPDQLQVEPAAGAPTTPSPRRRRPPRTPTGTVDVSAALDAIRGS